MSRGAGEIAAKSMRARPIRAYLLLLLLVLLVPELLFTGALLWRLQASDAARSGQAALATAEGEAATLDRTVAETVSALRTLAVSQALTSGDMAAFGRRAREVAQSLREPVLLLNAAGAALLDTSAAGDAAGIGGGDQALARTVLAGQEPVVSNLAVAATGHGPALTVNVPALHRGSAGYVVTATLAPQQLSAGLRDRAPAGWLMLVIDAHDAILARSRGIAAKLGDIATADIRLHTTGLRGTWRGTARRGEATLAAYARLRTAPWRVVVVVPATIVQGPWRRAEIALVAGGLALLCLSAGLSWALARRIEGPLRQLALQARALGRGDAPGPPGSGLREVNQVAVALEQAGRRARERGVAFESERARLAALVEAVPVGLLIAVAPTGEIVFGNGQIERMLGHPVLRSRNADEYGEWVGYHADGRQVLAEEYPLARALAGEVRPVLQLRYRRGDGSLLWIQVAGAPVRGADGVITGAVVAITDVDEVERAREERTRFAERLGQEVAHRTGELEVALARLRAEGESRAAAEEQLRQAQKMEAVGQLTGGIAHDFNNLLTVVVGSLDLLRRRVEGERVTRLVDNAMDGAQRAATLTQRLLAFSRQQPLAPRPVDVNRLVAGMSDLLRRTLGEQIQVETVLAGGLWAAMADPNQLESALLNLAVNARDAMTEGDEVRGRLTIETANTYLDDVYAASSPEVMAGQYVQLAVTDTGSGMTPEVAARVFEPFFTTKAQGKGTGLGLSQVHGFVKQTGGHVAIYSETREGPGRGTTVKLYLPRHKAAGVLEPAERPMGEATPGGIVLLVEDEVGVRRFSAEALGELGYTVLEAADGLAALSLLDAYPVAVLFTDVVLPGMDGKRLAEEARRRRPGLPVLFTTGYTRNAIVHNGQLDPGVDLITKPFTAATLAAKLIEVMSRGAGTKA